MVIPFFSINTIEISAGPSLAQIKKRNYVMVFEILEKVLKEGEAPIFFQRA